METNRMSTAIFAAGCFWCLEAQFQFLEGVKEIISGFTGGQTPQPTYKQVCTGTTGHAEACKITFDKEIISYQSLLFAFFKTHDPTQLNRQGNDIGTQYRSAIFYLDEFQKAAVEECLTFLEKNHVYDKPIVTEVTKAKEFYPAENYHKDYFNLNGDNPYCSLVVAPKVRHFLDYLQEKERKTSI